MLSTPKSSRRDIPFYIAKTEADFRADPYERYEEQVTRQLGLHYGQTPYAWQALEDWFLDQLPLGKHILEIGCGVGRLIGQVALQCPQSQCYGFDYSYQMLRVAHDYWRSSKVIEWQQSSFGQTFRMGARPPLPNLQFGLAAANDLPFPDNSLDTILSSFLFDRLPHPEKALEEWKRILRPGGRLLLASPLNFQQRKHWDAFHPIEKLMEYCRQTGWTVSAAPKTLLLRQSIDQNDNSIHWKAYCWVLTKTAW